MTTLGRRLTALEQIAEKVRRQEVRDLVLSLPEAHDLTPAEVEAATDEGLALLDQADRLRRSGLSEREILHQLMPDNPLLA
jgi:hypothetical protein